MQAWGLMAHLNLDEETNNKDYKKFLGFFAELHRWSDADLRLRLFGQSWVRF